MPAVNFELMYQAMVREAKGDFNQILFWSRLPTWKNQTLTPNPDAVYLMPFYNTKDLGPMVLEIPPAPRDQSRATSTMAGKSRWKMSARLASTKGKVASA